MAPEIRTILASRSAIRHELLEKSGVPFSVKTAGVDEDAIKLGLKAQGASGPDIAATLADVKAQRVSAKYQNHIVLGADQVLVCEDRLFDKPNSIKEAREHLLFLRSKSHELVSAAVAYEGGQHVWRVVRKAQLTMRDFSEAFLDDYLGMHGEDLLTTVGCYKLERDGPTLFSNVSGDYFTILGLPLLEVLGFLRTRGVIPE